MKSKKIITLFLYLISSVFFPATSSAVGNYNSGSGILVIPEVDVDGSIFFDNVSLKLNFSNGTFELVDYNSKPDNISITPIDSMEEQDIKINFMGCGRSGRNEVTCHMKLISLGGIDRTVELMSTGFLASSTKGSLLFDDLGNTYKASVATLGNIEKEKGSVKLLLVAGVPVLAKLKFIDISPNASSLSLLQPEFRLVDFTKFYGDFRNIAF